MDAISQKMQFDSSNGGTQISRKSKLNSAKETKKISKRKQRKQLSSDEENSRIAAYQKSLLRRGEVQDLVDYTSPKIIFHQMNLNPFGNNHWVAEHFNLVSMEGKPVKNVVVCKICKRVQIRFQNGTTNLKSHLKHHKIQLPQSSEKTQMKGANKKRAKEQAEESAHDDTLIFAE